MTKSATRRAAWAVPDDARFPAVALRGDRDGGRVTAGRLKELRRLNAVNGGLTRAQGEELLAEVETRRPMTPEAFAAMPEWARDAWLHGTSQNAIALPKGGDA